MLFFLDENFPKKAIPFLNDKGHETLDIRGTPQEGLDDRLIFDLAQEKGAVFLTTDRDFFHMVPFLYDDHHGIIVIALSQPNTQNILGKLAAALTYTEKMDIRSHCFLLTDTRITFGPRTKPKS
jgi:predicted nuclease of predicted toxin-antitoxin system